MKHRSSVMLLLLCLVCALALTACHTNADPWPASGAPTAVEESGTEAQEPAQGSGAEATAEPTDTHELDTGSDPGLNG